MKTHEKMQTNTTNMATIDLNHECIHKKKSAISTHSTRGLKSISEENDVVCTLRLVQKTHTTISKPTPVRHQDNVGGPNLTPRRVMDTDIYVCVCIYKFYSSPSQQVIELG